jgi:hypothetical protein
MAYLFDDFQKLGKEHLEVVTTSSSSLAKSWLAMRDSDTEWQIGKTMAEVLRERLVESWKPGSHRRRDRGDRRQTCFCAQAADPV